ncbi:hypothetical protein HAN_2g261 (nucleomorph) [Hemiselmis andersenii]|uniref:Uncharacterized protein n=1 Tax=Hemiselmis andersenii TaxID=464988 RepID=A9BKT0_HEMAN|nr:hypothetical protein HAN_2g261 [Hemiselmis andersenii]ABW98085.1 hypothetical protein HAN_2g261 [Hemiselmis andersenii]
MSENVPKYNTQDLFLIIDSELVFEFLYSKEIKSNKLFHLKNFFSKIKAFEKRIFEQTNFFLDLFVSKNEINFFYLIFTSQNSKWIFPISNKKKNQNLNKKIFLFLKKLFLQELKILRLQFFENKKRNSMQLKNLMSSLDLIVYIAGKTKKIKNKIKITSIISSKTRKEHIAFSNQLFFLAQKNKFSFDTLLFGRKDCFFFHFLSEKTKGIYCRPLKNLFELAFTEEFITILLSLFLTSPFSREFYILPFSTKILNKKNTTNLIAKKKFSCPICFSIFNFLFTNCFVCGFVFSF